MNHLDADDYGSITSELLHLEQHERTVRRDLEGVQLEDYSQDNDDDDEEPCWASRATPECGLVMDDDEDDFFASPSGNNNPETPQRKCTSTRRTSWGHIPGALLSMSPFSNSTKTMMTRTTPTTTTQDDDDGDDVGPTTPFDVPEIISFGKMNNNSKAAVFGFENQITKDDFMQLQQDLETALTDVSSFFAEETTTTSTTTTTTRKHDKKANQKKEEGTLNHLGWQIVVRLADHLYGDPKDTSFEAKICAMFLARSDIPSTWKRQRLAATAATV